MTFSTCLLLSALALSSSEPGTQQSGVDTVRAVESTATLTVRSDVDSAVVILDAHPAGRTPLVIDTIVPGVHIVRVIEPDVTNWLAAVASDTIVLKPGEARVLRYRLNSMISIDTRPSGARLLSGDSLIGFTPFMLRTEMAHQGASFALVKNGFDSIAIHPEGAYRGILRVDLRPAWGANPEPEPGMEPSLSAQGDVLKISVAGGVTVLAGIAAAYMRIHADDLQAEYLVTGDAGLLTQRDHYDAGAAVALVITQIGVGFLCYLLLSE